MKRLLLAAVIFSLALSGGGCSHFSKQARQERAYRRYVYKSSVAHVQQSLKLRAGKMQSPPIPKPSDPVVTAASAGPESVTSSSNQ